MKPMKYRDLPNWAAMLERALTLDPPIEPPEAVEAGADVEVPEGRTAEHLTPEEVRAVCHFGWHLSPKSRQREYTDRHIRREAQRRADEEEPTERPPSKSAPWIRWDGGSRLACERCGDSYDVAMPAPLPIMAAILKAWSETHCKCKPPAQEEKRK